MSSTIPGGPVASVVPETLHNVWRKTFEKVVGHFQQLYDGTLPRPTNQPTLNRGFTLCDAYIFQSCMKLLLIMPSAGRFMESAQQAASVIQNTLPDGAFKIDLNTHHIQLSTLLNTLDTSSTNTNNRLRINKEKADRNLTRLMSIVSFKLLSTDVTNQVDYLGTDFRPISENITSYLINDQSAGIENTIYIVGKAANSDYWFQLPLAIMNTRSSWKWINTKYAILPYNRTKNIPILFPSDSSQVVDWDADVNARYSPLQTHFSHVPDLWNIRTDWGVVLTSVKTAFEQNPISSAVPLLWDMYLGDKNLDDHPRLPLAELEVVPPVPMMQASAATLQHENLNRLYQTDMIEGPEFLFPTIDIENINEDRIPTQETNWLQVQQSLVANYDKSMLTRYYEATQLLQKLTNNGDMNPPMTASPKNMNKLRIYVITLGLKAFEEQKTIKQNAGEATATQKRHILPSLRLLNSILYFFDFAEPHRLEFMAKFSQILAVSMYRSRIPFMKYDIVEYQGQLAMVVNDGWSKNDMDSVQTQVIVRKIDANGQFTVDPDFQTSAQPVGVFELKLVTGLDLIDKYKFVLPGCQSKYDFDRIGNTNAHNLAILTKSYQEQSSILSWDKRLDLAMTYHRCTAALTNILISSMAQVQDQYGVQMDQPTQMGQIAALGGGKNTKHTKKRKASKISKKSRKVSKLQGGASLFDIAKGMWASLKSMVSSPEVVNLGLADLAQQIQQDQQQHGTRTSSRLALPQLPEIYALISMVNRMTKINLGIQDNTTATSLIFTKFYNSQNGVMGQVSDVALSGVTKEFKDQVKGWINARDVRDVSTKFEVLWRIPYDTIQNYGANSNYMYKLIGVNPTGNLDVLDDGDLDRTVSKIILQVKDIMEVMSKSLGHKSGDATNSRADRAKIDGILSSCRNININTARVELDHETRSVLDLNLNAFLDRAVVFMLANIDPNSPNERSNYILNVVSVILQYALGDAVANLQYNDGTKGWVFDVQNYHPKEFLRIENFKKPYPDLDKKFNTAETGFLPHKVFSNALAKLNSLDVSKRNTSQSISSYSHVTMFLNCMDRILAKLGSVVKNNDNYFVMHTNITNTQVSITWSFLPYGEYMDSLDSIRTFMKRDLFKVAKDMHENSNNYQLSTPQLAPWMNALKEERNDPYGSFELAPSEYRPCLRMFNQNWYYACAWNFPLRILPSLVPIMNEKKNKGRATMAKIGCFDCNMYLVVSNHSFGISPGVFQMLSTIRDELKDKTLSTNDTKTLHAKTNYEMMFMEPMKYHLDIMPMYLETVQAIMSRKVSKETKAALGNPRSDSLGRKVKDVGKVIATFGNQVANVGIVSPTEYSRAIVSNIIYTIFAGNYYLPRGARVLSGGQGGQSDTVGALELAATRDASHNKPDFGNMYETFPLEKLGSNISPIVYSIFYMFNGIMGIPGHLSPYIFTYYEAYNQKQKEGHGAFVKEFFARKDKAQGFTIDSKLAALDLSYPTSPTETLEEAQEEEVKKQDSSSSSSSSSYTGNLTPAQIAIVTAAGLMGLYEEMQRCTTNTDLAKDHRDTCDEAKKAIEVGTKDHFRVGFPKSHGWERAMKKYPDYFAKSKGIWTDAHDVDAKMIRYDRAGNKIQRSEKGYNNSGLSVHQGNQRNMYGQGAQKQIAHLEKQLKEKQQSDMVQNRAQYREAGKKFREGGAANLEFTDKQGNTVFKMLPHNIVANVLMLGFAGMTAWAASSGTSTYTRLLDVEFKKGSKKLADLLPLQKTRMACSFFFGMGLGIFVAFIASVVEMVNHKRVRQALFILLMAAPIIVLGAIGVMGANKTCEMNPGGVCPVNDCNSNGACELDSSQTSCSASTPCKTNTCDSGKCHFDKSDCTSDAPASAPSVSDTSDTSQHKRTKYLPKSTSKFPRLSNFWKSLMGQHESDVDLGDDPDPTKQNSDDVLRFNVKASDFMFIGLGCGVLIAGVSTILPDNPFHPSSFDVEYQSAKQKGFATISQVNPKWWIYGLVFSLIMAGGGTSSLLLTTTRVETTKDDNGRDVRKSGQMQAAVAIGVAVLLFVAILFLGRWHLKRHTKLGKLMENYNQSQPNSGTAAGQLLRS